jgi:deoxyribodipyrimidine photo-lyase
MVGFQVSNPNLEKREINIVWFKRDLRLSDNEALTTAIQNDLPILLLYIFEPKMQNCRDWDIRHSQFVYHSIADINQRLPKNGIQILYGETIEVFENLAQSFRIKQVFSHEETGNRFTFDRDVDIGKWFLSQGINWKEMPNNGVVRKLKSRKLFPKIWQERMKGQVVADPKNIDTISIEPTKRFLLPEKLETQLNHYPKNFQPAGETYAHRYLSDFFKVRFSNYSKHISKPDLARKSCSRLSPYLAWGNLSMRQVVQATMQKLAELNKQENIAAGRQKQALANFYSRLNWQAHFIQKFESECRIEFEPMNKLYLTLEKEEKPELINAWKKGQTGFPLIDACMRCVKETGYLNFRMRAMVVSFYGFNLWQPWKIGADYLAQQFLDYEPGIHFPQVQMQTGLTGINTLRVYNPVLNGLKHDSDAVFIKKWLPELQQLPTEFAHEPWKMTELDQKMYHFKLGENYPKPIIDLEETRKRATRIMYQSRKSEELQNENQRILQKHTHRKSVDSQLVVNFDSLANDEEE